MFIIKKKYIFILILIFALDFDSAISQEPPGKGFQASKLNITFNLLPNEIALNQEIEIFFNISNKDLGYKADARNVVFEASLSNSLAMPEEEILTENNNCSHNNGLEICSNNFKSGDFAFVKPDRTIMISLTKLSRNEYKIIKYKTIYIGNNGKFKNKICSNWQFNWEREYSGVKDPFIPQILEINNKIEFKVNISPEHNITYQNDEKCTIFKDSNVLFFTNLNNSHNFSFKDIRLDAIPPLVAPIINGDPVRDLGKHQFSIEVYDLDYVSYANSSRYFEVIDLIDNHKDLLNPGYIFKKNTIYPSLFISLIICLVILRILRRIDPCKNNTCKSSANNICIPLYNKKIKERLLVFIFIIQLFIYYYYIHYSTNSYKNLIYLEMCAVVIAFAVLQIYIYYDNIFCKLQVIERENFIPFAFSILILGFHFILPYILFKWAIYLIAFAVFVDIIIIILGKLGGESDNINIKVIISAIFITSILFLSTRVTLTFKPQFDFLELIVIEMLYVAYLVLFARIILSYNEVLGGFKKIDFARRLMLISEKVKEFIGS